jgi:hypothetical protein
MLAIPRGFGIVLRLKTEWCCGFSAVLPAPTFIPSIATFLLSSHRPPAAPFFRACCATLPRFRLHLFCQAETLPPSNSPRLLLARCRCRSVRNPSPLLPASRPRKASSRHSACRPCKGALSLPPCHRPDVALPACQQSQHRAGFRPRRLLQRRSDAQPPAGCGGAVSAQTHSRFSGRSARCAVSWRQGITRRSTGTCA